MTNKLYPIGTGGDSRYAGKAGNKGTNAEHNTVSGLSAEAQQIERSADYELDNGIINKKQWKRQQKKANALRKRAASINIAPMDDLMSGFCDTPDTSGIV